MNYYELIITLVLQKDMEVSRSYEQLSRMISTAMLHDKALKQLHGQSGIKGYTLCNMYPREIDKVYKKNRMYAFSIRSLNMEFILKIKAILPHVQPGIVATQIKTCKYRYISSIKSLTPVVATLENRSWTKEDGILLLMQRCHSNAVRKYRELIGEMPDPEENFIEYIELLNNKPIKIPYKNNSLLGSKVKLGIKSSETAQKLAFTVLGAGLLEKNTLGMGYCVME